LTGPLESRTLRNSVKPRHFNHVVGVDLGGGKGKKPKWLTDALESGRQLEEFGMP